MVIKSAHLENFTVFEESDIEFSKGINVIIGENGVGKTHLLKLLHSACQAKITDKKSDIAQIDNFSNIDYANLLLGYMFSDKKFPIEDMKLLCNVIGKFMKIGVEFDDYSFEFNYNHKGKDVYIDIPNQLKKAMYQSIFIPAKEFLSHSKSLLALDNEREIPFDNTIIDIIAKAELGESKKNLPFEILLIKELSNVIDGEVIYENDTFFIVKNDGRKVEFSVEADGLKKFGLLWKLIRNGLIRKGTTLFWDEPEANINPELMPVLTKVLLELQRNDVQVILATHSYSLAKCFELYKTDEDKLLFYNLYLENKKTKIASNEYFGELTENKIIEADAMLLDELFYKSYGGRE